MGLCVSKPNSINAYQVDERGTLQKVTIDNPTAETRQRVKDQKRALRQSLSKEGMEHLKRGGSMILLGPPGQQSLTWVR